MQAAETVKRLTLFSKVNRVAAAFHNANRTLKKMSPIDLTDDDVFGFLKTLEKHKVRYLLVDGFAMAFHGYVRATHDLDLWLEDEDENIGNFRKSLTECGVTGLENIRSFELIAGFTEFKIGTSGFTVEPFKSLKVLSKYDFKECYERGVHGEFNDLQFKVIHAKDLLREKESTNRPKDQGDIDYLRSLE